MSETEDTKKPNKAPQVLSSKNPEMPLETPDLGQPLGIARPWSHASLVGRFGADGGEAAYCAIAIAGGYFNPKADMTHRPDLA